MDTEVSQTLRLSHTLTTLKDKQNAVKYMELKGDREMQTQTKCA